MFDFYLFDFYTLDFYTFDFYMLDFYKLDLYNVWHHLYDFVTSYIAPQISILPPSRKIIVRLI